MKRLAVALLVFLLACTGTTSTALKNSPKNKKIVKIQKILSNIPVFPGAKYDLDNTFIYESGNIKAAVITYRASGTLKDAVDFYKRKMIEEGWELVSSFIYKDQASLFFDSADSSCNIEVKGSGELTVTIRVGTKAPLQDGIK